MKSEIQIISKKETILKCSIFLFILSIAICVIENIDMNLLVNSLLKF